MKKSSDWLNVDSAGSEKIGVLLSASLKQSQSGDCLPLEEIATLVDGHVEMNDRDRIMNHLASCDRCYEVFLLTSGLNKQKIIPMTRTLFSHPMRLAASIIIAAFSLFLFYKIVFIPGISDKPDLKIEPVKEAAAPLMKEKYESEKREKGRGVLRMAEKSKTEEGGRAIPAGKPAAESPRGKKQPGKAATKGGEKKTAARIVQQHQRQIETEQPAAGQQHRYARQEKDTRRQETAVPEKVTLGDKRKSGRKLGKSAAAPAVPAGIETDPWSFFERLNGELSQYKTYIPDDKIEILFKTAVIAAEKLQHEFKEQEENRYAIDGVRIDEVPGRRLEPVMYIESQEGIVFIFPDTRYFLEKSEPGTRAYRFFSLALSGWCDERSCYGEIKGKIEKEKGEKLLANWQALRPELQGIFLTIADRTINHLKK
jgi:hypothetical protein